jgi:hypothetical protein
MSPRTIAHFANVSLWPAMQPSLDNGAHVLKAVVRWFGEDPFPVIDPVVIPPSERISEKARIWIDIYSWNFDGFSSEIYDMDQACEILEHASRAGRDFACRAIQLRLIFAKEGEHQESSEITTQTRDFRSYSLRHSDWNLHMDQLNVESAKDTQFAAKVLAMIVASIVKTQISVQSYLDDQTTDLTSVSSALLASP